MGAIIPMTKQANVYCFRMRYALIPRVLLAALFGGALLQFAQTSREGGLSVRIDLKYRYSRYVDEFGNEFRYRGRLWDDAGRGREPCYDVFLSVLGE